METKFYNRATGRLTKSSYQSYTEKSRSKKHDSTIYTIEDTNEDFKQYPCDILSSTQKLYINIFLRSISNDDTISIDSSIRAIHWIAAWKSKSDNITISLSLLQPHITNATLQFPGLTESSVRNHISTHFENTDMGLPHVQSTRRYCTSMGKFAVPLADSLIDNNLITYNKISWSMVVLGQTQPIFVIVYANITYECTMTHMSCCILSDHASKYVRISHPISNSQNFSFRSPTITEGEGTGPAITIHSSGILQYQGNPKHIALVVSSFRNCIMSIMDSEYAYRFVRSLAIIREIE